MRRRTPHWTIAFTESQPWPLIIRVGLGSLLGGSVGKGGPGLSCSACPSPAWHHGGYPLPGQSSVE